MMNTSTREDLNVYLTIYIPRSCFPSARKFRDFGMYCQRGKDIMNGLQYIEQRRAGHEKDRPGEFLKEPTWVMSFVSGDHPEKELNYKIAVAMAAIMDRALQKITGVRPGKSKPEFDIYGYQI